MKNAIKIVFACLCLLSHIVFANPPLAVPEDLAAWKGWVLKGSEQLLCPIQYDNDQLHYCVWPSDLSLVLNDTQGQFEQHVMTYVEGFVSLPGELNVFPYDVKVNGKPFAVIAVDNVPSVFLPAGEYTISGQFAWKSIPDSFPLPRTLGTLTLKIGQTVLEQPDRDALGRLWIRRQSQSNIGSKDTDELSLKVFRLIDDSIPQTETTVIRLLVSGKNREVTIGPIFQADQEPLSVQSALPSQLTENNQLRIQVKPGTWEITIKSRFLKQRNQFALSQMISPWPSHELWSFQAHNDLRLVDLGGAVSIDPKQTDLPKSWWNYPAFLLKDKSILTLTEKRRGQVEQHGENLELARQLWLDFSGKGYTIVDTLKGSIEHHWRLSQIPPYQLGRVSIDGQDKLITRVSPEGPAGVEIRQGQLNLVSVSRILERTFQMPALSWDVDVKKLSATLYLPPGWILLGTSGADTSQAWIQKWTLLDLFLVLVIAAAVLKLIGSGYGLIAIITLAITYHEQGSPVWLWLNLIAAFALVKVLEPGGRAERWVLYYFKASFVVLIVMMIPFMVYQIRNAMYPQLSILDAPKIVSVQTMMPQENAMMALGSVAGTSSRQAKPFIKKKMFEPATVKTMQPTLDEYDPSEKTQTGPGVPRWKWNAYELTWSGPVLQGQILKLWLVPKMITSMLKILSAFLMAWLAYGFARPLANRFFSLKSGSKFASWGVIFMLPIVMLLGMSPQVVYADYPSEVMLTQLRDRLLEPPTCSPNCADVNRMQIQVTPTQLTIRMSAQFAANVAIPLPSQLGKWMPRTVMIDNVLAKQLQVDEQQQLWLQGSEGVHEILLEGPISSLNAFDLSVPLQPKQITITQEGWQVEGVFEQKLQARNLSFIRTSINQTDQTQSSGVEFNHIPPFILVQRDFKLGIDWEIVTTVRRLAPQQGSILLNYPLLEGESVLSDAVQVKEGKAIIQLGADQNELQFSSKFKIVPTVSLIATDNPNIKEVWQWDPTTRWNCTFEGIPMIHQKANQARWLPTWEPWPGEKLSIQVVRPEGVPGNTLTIEDSQLLAIPGRQASRYELSLTARTSQGTNYDVQIPHDAQVQEIRINGVSQPITLKEGTLTLPLTPGVQKILIKWQSLEGLTRFYRTPTINLRQQNSNNSLQVELSKKDRWILLLGGPSVGPAILFWGILLVILIIAVGLGRSGSTPLRSWEWVLLALGITLASPLAGIFIVAWFVAMQKRQALSVHHGVQIGLIVLTVCFVVSLFTSISQGLLELPTMQIKQPLVDLFLPYAITSNDYVLRWYQDVSGDQFPFAWIISVPLMIYRVLMLLWALWLAFSFVKWIRWGWNCFSTRGYW